MDVVEEYYKYFETDVEYVNHIAANHCFPTDNEFLLKTGHYCAYFGPNFINYCDFDGVESMFKHIIPNQERDPIKNKLNDWEKYGELHFFDQSEFFETPE